MISLHSRRIKHRSRQQRDKRTSYRSVLFDADLSICTDEEKLELLKKVREGNKVAIERMILSHVALSISIVNRYIGVGTLKYLANDLDSAAMIGIVFAVNRVAEGKMANHDNITGYIVKNVHSSIIKAIQHSDTIYVPRRQQNKIVECLYASIPRKDSQLSIQQLEIWDLIDSLTDDDLEMGILKLKSEGRTDTEVGELVGLNRLQVLRIRSDLFRRYKRKENQMKSN